MALWESRVEDIAGQEGSGESLGEQFISKVPEGWFNSRKERKPPTDLGRG